MAFWVGVRSIADTNCTHEQISIYYKTQQQAKFCVELAINNEERQRGLMFRKGMKLSDGMMFDDGTLLRLSETGFRWICGDEYSGEWLKEIAKKKNYKVNKNNEKEFKAWIF